MTYENFWNRLEMEVERSMEKPDFVMDKKYYDGIWTRYEEPQITISEPLDKKLKKWLRMQIKNRRRWGG